MAAVRPTSWPAETRSEQRSELYDELAEFLLLSPPGASAAVPLPFGVHPDSFRSNLHQAMRIRSLLIRTTRVDDEMIVTRKFG
jgi:hypothetical protein